MSNDPIPQRAVTGLLQEILAALDTAEADPARAAHVVRALRHLLAGPAPDADELVNVAAVLNMHLHEMLVVLPGATDPQAGPFSGRPQAEAAFAGFRDAAVRGYSGPPGEQLVFTTHQHLSAAFTDAIEGFGAYVGAYDRMLIARLASYLDPVDVGVACSWIYRVADAIQGPARPEAQ